MKSNLWIFTLLAGLAFQLACGKNAENPPASSAKPIQIPALTILEETIPAVVEAPGTVQPRNRITLSSQINGFVREMRVRVGDTVAAGQVLARLDARDPESQRVAAQSAVTEAQAALSEARQAYQAAVEMKTAAKASADLAAQTLSRYEKLFASQSVSPQEIDEARMRRNASAAELASRASMVAAAEDRIKQVESKISQAKAQAQRADVLMSWTQIQAPSAGRVVERPADPGTAIFPGTPLLMLESMTSPQVLADIPTERAGILRPGIQVRIRNSATEEIWEGRVTEIAPTSNPAAHSVQFKVDLPQKASLLNGQFVSVLVPAGTRKALLAPKAAIRETGQLTGLFVIDGASNARFRLAKLTPYDSTRSEILSGVESGEKIVSQLNSQIVDGIPVEAR